MHVYTFTKDGHLEMSSRKINTISRMKQKEKNIGMPKFNKILD